MLVFQLLSIGLALFLSVIVVLRNPSDRNRWLLLLFNAAVGWWIVSYIFADMPSNLSLFWNKMVFINALVMSYAGYLLIASMARRLGKATVVAGLVLLTWSSVVLFTPLIVQDIAPRLVDGALQGYNIVRGPGYFLYVASLLVTSLSLIGFIFRLSRKARGRFKNQLRIIMSGFLGMLIAGVTTGVVLPILLSSSAPANYSFLSAFLIMAAFMYSIVQQRLFDIRLAITRTVAYLLALLAVTVFYAFAIFGIADVFFHNTDGTLGTRIYYTVAALVVAATFRPLQQLFTRITRRLFFRDTYLTQEVLSRLTALLVRTVDLKLLTQESAAILQDALKVEKLDIITKRPGNHDALLTSLARVSTWPIVVDELAYQDRSVAEKLIEQKISLVSRLKTSQGVVGYITCGGKLRGDALTSQDIELISVASDELAVAVQNALRFEEISRFNLTLKEEVGDATSQLRASNRKLHMLDEAKDEFISMASHQLRTPLTSVKGYLSMVLEGDAGSITAEQRKLLQEAYGSSQRMVYLIGDFLNLSRLQTGKFVLEITPVNLARLVGDEVNQLQATAARRGVTLEFHAPSDFPEVPLDDSKIRQVIMNLIDNAIFYSRPNSVVAIELTSHGHDVSLHVRDAGIGVPASERHHLFTKFYRATNARKVRPDGTGIGLYMAKKVVTAHGGSIIFETKENHGSTFGFKLPLKH